MLADGNAVPGNKDVVPWQFAAYEARDIEVFFALYWPDVKNFPFGFYLTTAAGEAKEKNFEVTDP